MIKIICVNNKWYESSLTINNIYEGESDGFFYKIINEHGNYYYYHKHRFITLAEFREQRINKILND